MRRLTTALGLAIGVALSAASAVAQAPETEPFPWDTSQWNPAQWWGDGLPDTALPGNAGPDGVQPDGDVPGHGGDSPAPGPHAPSADPSAQQPAPQFPMPATIAVPLPPGCSERPGAIGLSRIVEIDTTGGPRFGHSQYKDIDFLEPGEVVLTFDDGPLRRYTKPILDALDRHCTRATFFSVGRMAISDPATLKEIAARGHTIASHTYSHAKLPAMSPEKARVEIELGYSAVTRALGQPIAPFFRFPYLRDSKSALELLKSRDMSAFSIEVDSQDFRAIDPGQVQRNVLSQLKVVKKGIILFHDIQPKTAAMLPGLLEALKANGYRVVHLISKYPGTTLPEFDAIADREIEKKRLALAGQPLADRAVNWPNSPGPNSPVPNGAGMTPDAADNAEILPWAVKPGPTADRAGSSTPARGPVAAPAKPLGPGPHNDAYRVKTPGE